MQNSKVQKLAKLAKLGKLGSLAKKLQDEAHSKKKKKRLWVRDWVGRRQQEVPLYSEIEAEDQNKFLTNFRLNPQDFGNLLSRYKVLLPSGGNSIV